MNQPEHLLCLMVLVTGAFLQSLAYLHGPVQEAAYERTIKVACIGDSVVYGAAIKDREKNCYPAQLQRMLGDRWEVRNYGINSRTMLKTGDFPYWNDAYFQEVQKWKPDVVVISLGGNDTKPRNWNHEAYKRDCAAMVDVFQSLAGKPIVRLCYPVPAYRVQWGINDEIIRNEVIPIMDEVAKAKNIDIIDNHTALSNKEALFGDKIHPNAEGAGAIARSVYRSLTGHTYTIPPLPGTCSDWFGYPRYNFRYDGRNCVVVVPKVEAAGRPWIWRARFFGHEPQTDLWLLARGFYVVYMDVADMFGAPAAVAHWDAFYKYLTEQFAFSSKPSLEGMSRGGLIVMNWAKKNPNRVSCIYIDAPVCDIRSWPGGLGDTTAADPALWKKCLEVYGLTEEQARTFDDNPIDRLEALAKAGVPIFSVCGDADTAAIMDENIRVLEKRYKALGGRIDVLVKEGVGHHPHSLKVPAPIVNFVIANTTGLDRCFILREDGLKNSQIRFEKDRQGRVVFLGGSITHMSGWRDQVCEYLQKRFPETQFDFVNAGIPSTGSTPGAFRLIRDVFSDGPVDLLFEEAAVNDLVNGRSGVEQVRGMEGILRHALRINPKLDIVTMYFVDEDKIARYNQGQTPEVIGNHDRVCGYYGISSINLAWEVTDRINAGQFTWKDDFKDVHPSPFGQTIYSAAICRLLDSAWSNPLWPSDAAVPHWMPEKPLDAFSYFNGRLEDIRKAHLETGWKLDAAWHPTDNVGTRPGFVDVPMLTAEKPEAVLRFPFTGTAVGLFIPAGPDCGIIEYSVDGKPFKQVDQFTAWSPGLYIPWALMLETELDSGTHELVLKTTGLKNVKSKGTACRIVHFLVNDSQFVH